MFHMDRVIIESFNVQRFIRHFVIKIGTVYKKIKVA